MNPVKHHIIKEIETITQRNLETHKENEHPQIKHEILDLKKKQIKALRECPFADQLEDLNEDDKSMVSYDRGAYQATELMNKQITMIKRAKTETEK